MKKTGNYLYENSPYGFLRYCRQPAFLFPVFQIRRCRTGLKKLIEVLNPIIYGFIIAYILNPPMQF